MLAHAPRSGSYRVAGRIQVGRTVVCVRGISLFAPWSISLSGVVPATRPCVSACAFESGMLHHCVTLTHCCDLGSLLGVPGCGCCWSQDIRPTACTAVVTSRVTPKVPMPHTQPDVCVAKDQRHLAKVVDIPMAMQERWGSHFLAAHSFALWQPVWLLRQRRVAIHDCEITWTQQVKAIEGSRRAHQGSSLGYADTFHIHCGPNVDSTTNGPTARRCSDVRFPASKCKVRGPTETAPREPWSCGKLSIVNASSGSHFVQAHRTAACRKHIAPGALGQFALPLIR